VHNNIPGEREKQGEIVRIFGDVKRGGVSPRRGGSRDRPQEGKKHEGETSRGGGKGEC